MPDIQESEKVTALTEASARGINRGWDAANFAEAYSPNDHAYETAVRSARETYSTDTAEGDLGIGPKLRHEYANGFMLGWTRYNADKWQDGSGRTDDN